MTSFNANLAAKANSTLKNLLSYKRLRYSTSVRTYWSSIENSSACSSWSKKRPLASCTPPCTLKIEARPVRPPQPSNYWTWLWQREDPTLQICKTNRRNSIWDWLTVLTIEIVSKLYQYSNKIVQTVSKLYLAWVAHIFPLQIVSLILFWITFYLSKTV